MSDTSGAIEVQSASPALLRVAVGGRPAIWARVEGRRSGWSWLHAADNARTWPAPSASAIRVAARRRAGSDAWLGLWIETWWREIERASARMRGRVDVVPLRDGASAAYTYLDALQRWDRARVRESWVAWNWDSAVLPLRAWPDADDGRVKAYRKLARARELPPIVLRWVSGLMAHIVVDGHARVIAAELERVAPHAIAIVPVYPRATRRRAQWAERATAAVEALLASPDSKTRFHALDALNRNAIDRATDACAAIERARPIPGGAHAWRAEVVRALGPRGAAQHTRDLLAPFERPTRYHFV